MSNESRIYLELHELLADQSAGEMTQEQADRLEELVRGDPRIARIYVEYMRETASLRWGFQHDADLPSADSALIGTSPDIDREASAKEEASSSRDSSQPDSPVLGFLGSAVSFASRPAVAVTLVVFVLIPLGLALLGVFSMPGQQADDPVVAQIIGLTDDCRWQERASAWEPESKIRAGERILLDAGLAQVEFGSGAVVLVEGPAAFMVSSSVAGTLEEGKLTAQVPNRARGFTIHTPLASAVDLGTEFGVVVEANGVTDVRVFQGSVRLSGAPSRGELEGGPRKLVTGDALQVTYDATQRLLAVRESSRELQLVRDWPERTSELGEYAQAILADQPLAYWPLYQSGSDGHVSDVTGNGYDGKIRGTLTTVSAFGDEGPRRAMDFNGVGDIIIEQVLPSSFSEGFTAEAWAKVHDGQGNFRCILASRHLVDIPGSGSNRQDGFVLYAADTGRWEFWLGRGASPRGSWARIRGSNVEMNRWFHVVGTFEPDGASNGMVLTGTAKLYVNGRLTTEETHSFSPNVLWQTRIGSVYHKKIDPNPYRFKGLICDVAVYESVLGDEQIRRHYQLGNDQRD